LVVAICSFAEQNMDPKEQLINARNALQAEVDKVLEALPAYQALQRVEQAIDALGKSSQNSRPQEPNLRLSPSQSYAALAVDAIVKAAHPLTTPEIIEYISKYRALAADPERAKINIASALSKEENLKNIRWKDGRAWWLSGEKLFDSTGARG
jgi:hypothetical protein